MRVRRTVRNARSLLPSRRFPKSAPLSKSMSNPIDLSGPLLCTMSKKGRKFKDDQSYILAASPNTSMMNTGRSEIRALPSNVSEWCLGYIRTLFRLMSRWRIRVFMTSLRWTMRGCHHQLLIAANSKTNLPRYRTPPLEDPSPTSRHATTPHSYP